MIRYRKILDDTYQATDGAETVDVMRCWYRDGGWQWECREVHEGIKTLRRPTRKGCAEAAIGKLHRMRAEGLIR